MYSRAAFVFAAALAASSVSFVSLARADSAPQDQGGMHGFLSPQQRAMLVADAGKLGETPPPPGLDQQAASQVTTAVQESFVNTFRLLSIISAGMALLSAALAWLLVESPGQIRQEAPSGQCSARASPANTSAG